MSYFLLDTDTHANWSIICFPVLYYYHVSTLYNIHSKITMTICVDSITEVLHGFSSYFFNRYQYHVCNHHGLAYSKVNYIGTTKPMICILQQFTLAVHIQLLCYNKTHGSNYLMNLDVYMAWCANHFIYFLLIANYHQTLTVWS